VDAVNTTLLTSPVTLISQRTARWSLFLCAILKKILQRRRKRTIMANSSETPSNELPSIYKIDVFQKDLRERIWPISARGGKKRGVNTLISE
jgi:hypothetical protein